MKNMEVEEISKVSKSSVHNKALFINDDSSTVEIYKSSFNEAVVSEEISKLVSDTCDTVQIIVNDKSSIPNVHKPSVNSIVISDTCDTVPIIVNGKSSISDVCKVSENDMVVSEEISDTCDTVPIIVNDKPSMADVYKPPVNGIVISEEIYKFISDTCNTVEIIVNNDATDNSYPAVIATTTDSEGIPKTFETVNDDLFDAEMGNDDDNGANAAPSSDKNESLIDEEMNEEGEECTNSFVETDIKDPTSKEVHWTKRASLPYYREPKPDFFEYTRKLQEKLEPKPSVTNSSLIPKSSTRIIVLDDPSSQEPDLLKSSTISGTYRNKTSAAIDLCLEKSNGKPSRKPVSGLIILDDYKSPRVKNSHFSRSSDMWNLSSLSSTKEKPEPVPGAKYKALKEQLMEKIMLKKEESLNKRKAEQEIDEENFEEEEEIEDVVPYESDNGSSDDEMDDDSPENTEDDIVLKDMLLKECENFPENVSGEIKDNIHTKNSENEQFNPAETISEDSQEPMECYSLPSYQPGGGFSKSPAQKRDMKRVFSDSDFNDSAMVSSSQPKSMGRIFSDSDFIDSAPSGSSGSSQLKNIPGLDFKDSGEEQLPFESSEEQEIIPHWESLPISERQGSQLFDEDISVICSGKFPSTNEGIPWTPSSSLKDSFPNKESFGSSSSNNHTNDEPDQLNESDDEELVRPAKKIKLSLVDKLWDSEDENDDDSNNPITQNGELKGNHTEIQSDSDVDDAVQNHEPDVDADSEEEDDELHDKSEISQKHANVSFEDSLIEDADDKESAKRFEINNFFEDEAELSGEEGSSDENEDDVDEGMLDGLITDEIVASEEKLRKEVGTIHFKRQQDEDEQILRQIKEDFLPEGELYNENGQRKRRYIWNNIGMDDNEFTETKSESEEEEIESLPTDYLKWQQEKNKSNLPEDDDEEIQTPKSIGLKVDIIGKVSVTHCSSVSSVGISASPMLRRGSFLNSSIGKNLKLIKEFGSSEGSVSRKNFVFSSPAPQPNASLPSTPASEVKSKRISNIINNRSIFNKI